MSPSAYEKALRRRMSREAKLAKVRLLFPRGKETGLICLDYKGNFLTYPLDSTPTATAGRLDEVLRWIRERR